MTVRELIARFQQLDPDKPVWMCVHRHSDLNPVSSAEEQVISDEGGHWSVGESDDSMDENRIVVLIS